MATELQLNDPETLYRRWEDSQWSPYAVDLKVDKEQWPSENDLREFALDGLTRRLQIINVPLETVFA
jgi:hypothetical protein